VSQTYDDDRKTELAERETSLYDYQNLQGKDPSLYEMILKMQTVQRRLIKKTEAVIAKEVELRDLERINGELKKQLIRRPGPDVAQRLNRFRGAVKARSRQIKASCWLAMIRQFNFHRAIRTVR